MQCPICNSEKIKIKFSFPEESIFSNNGNVTYHQCHKCGFIFNFFAHSLKTSDFYNYYQGSNDYNYYLYSILKGLGSYTRASNTYLEFILKSLNREQIKSMKCIDIGGGAGEFSFLMQEKGYIFDLVDFSSIRTEIAKNVFRIPNVFNREIDGNQYNLICLWQVIEHVPNPVGYLSDIIKNISDEKCHIFIATPNTTSFGAKYFRSKWKHFVSHHISLFSPTSISVLLERVGLKLLNIDENRMYSTKKSSIARSLIRHGVRLILFKKSNLRAFETDGLCVHGYKIDNK